MFFYVSLTTVLFSQGSFISGHDRSDYGKAVTDPGILKGNGKNRPKVEISMTIYPQCLYISEFYFEGGGGKYHVGCLLV